MKSRLLTATVLIALVLWMIFFAPFVVFEVFVGLFLALSAWEWIGLLPSSKANNRWLRILFVLLVEVAWVAFGMWPIGFTGLLYFDICLLLLLIPALLTYPKTMPYWHSVSSVIILGFSFLITASVSLMYLKHLPQGELWLMAVLLLTWMADTGAYFAGRFLGRRKLLPLVSPNKTWEGFWGGFLLSECIVVGFGFLLGASVMGWGFWLLAGTLAIIGSVIGDLFISMLKRSVQVKDTGSLLPGHGGILDRVDSLLVSSIIVVFFLCYLF